MTGPDPAAVVADTLAIARIPAPTGGEAARVSWLRRRLEGAPGHREVDEVGNLVWYLGDPPYDLALLVHVDTVFGAEVEHEPAERDGWLHGPGIGDNSVAVAVAAAVVEAAAGDLAGSLVTVFTVGEEGLGALRGARHACHALRPRHVLALEGHGLDTVYADAVGSVRVRLDVTGPGGHSWWDRDRPSAVHGLTRLLTELLDQAPAGLALNVGRVDGGSAVNARAASASAVLEGRCLDEQPLEQLDARLAELRVDAGLELTCIRLDRRPCGRLDRAHPLLAAVRQARASLDLADELTDGSTDANAALALGIPALALACARGFDMHASSERIQVSSIPLGIAQLDHVLRRFLEGER